MLLELLMKNQMVDFMVIQHYPEIEKWNRDRDNLKLFDIELEAKMLQEEYEEFMNATTVVDKLDALADFGFILGGSLAKFFHTNGTVDEYDATEFFTTYFGLFSDLFILSLTFTVNDDTNSVTRENAQDIFQEVMKIVIQANQQKGFEKDDNGKIKKPVGFISPESKIEALLAASKG